MDMLIWNVSKYKLISGGIMKKETLNLPMLIGGREIDGKNHFQLEYDDLIIRFPFLDDELRNTVISLDKDSIHDLTLTEIISFLQKVSELWVDENYLLRKKLLEYGPRISGQSPEMYKYNIGLLLQLISCKAYMYDVVDYELGDRRLLDEWISREHAEIHMEPLGKLLHIISGNVSGVGFYSIIRGLLTKNVNICKLSQKDFLSSYFFIRSFMDVDPDHPVSRSLAAVYWDKTDKENMDYFCNSVDGMIVWGGFDTINTYKSRCPVGCEFIEYGPKKGLQIIDYENNVDNNLELDVARDISLFDQEACLSPQLILLKGGDMRRFTLRLMNGLYRYSDLWPKGKYPADHYIHMNYLRRSHEYLGNFVIPEDNLKWMIIELHNLTNVNLDHPLGRTIFVKQIEDFDECLDYIDGNVQTVGISPNSLARDMRDKLTRRGVSRIANIGNVDMMREGTVHEGICLNRLVHLVGMEKERNYKVKEHDIPSGYFSDFVFRLVWEKKN